LAKETYCAIINIFEKDYLMIENSKNECAEIYNKNYREIFEKFYVNDAERLERILEILIKRVYGKEEGSGNALLL
jgi:hypothetical protein